MEPDFARLYALGETFDHGNLRARQSSGPGADDLRAICRGEQSLPGEAVDFRRDEGRKPVDFVGTTWGPPVYLVSQRLVDVLDGGGFRGHGIYPVSLKGGDGRRFDGYHGLTVSGRCGPTDDSLSERFMAPPRGERGRPVPARRGLYFRGGWDGSDVFMPANNDFEIVTEEVKQALEAAGVTGVRFERLDQIVLRGGI